MKLYEQVTKRIFDNGYGLLVRKDNHTEVWRCGEHLINVPSIILTGQEANEVMEAAGLKHRFENGPNYA